MDLITKSNGLIHISLKIFKLLDYQTLMACRNVNRQFYIALNDPKFWIEKIPSNINSNEDLKSEFKTVLSQIKQLDADSIYQVYMLEITPKSNRWRQKTTRQIFATYNLLSGQKLN